MAVGETGQVVHPQHAQHQGAQQRPAHQRTATLDPHGTNLAAPPQDRPATDEPDSGGGDPGAPTTRPGHRRHLGRPPPGTADRPGRGNLGDIPRQAKSCHSPITQSMV
ncbi:hypothetical protein GCM10009660_52550 [Catellatospora bangladeshensis]